MGVKRTLPNAATGMLRAQARGQLNSSMGNNMELPTAQRETPVSIADDLLEGADAIATYLFGHEGSRRKVYYLAECTKLPIFRLGSVLCARKSVLLKWISGQENRVLSTTD
jgi:hypothetical protein